MLKRVLSFILCLSILLCSISIYMYTPVYASDLYNTIYENYDYSSVISGHKSFNFTDKGGKKHPVVRIGNSWLAGFDSGQIISNDDDLNYYLSWYSYKGYNLNNDTGKGVLSLINSKLGAVVSLSSDLLSSVLLNVSDIDIDYNEDDGLTIASDSVDKLREQLKEQYYKSIGVIVRKPNSNVKSFVGSSLFRKMYDNTEDYTSDYARVIDYKYAFGYVTSRDAYRVYFTNELSDYFVLDTGDTISVSEDNYYRTSYALCTYTDGTLKKFNFGSFVDCFYYTHADELNDKNDIGLYYSSWLNYKFVFSPSNFSSITNIK